MRSREEEWERQADSRVRAIEARLNQEAQQREELFNQKLGRREQQLLAQADARRAELLSQSEQDARRREHEAVRMKQRELELSAQLAALAESHKNSELKWETEMQSLRANAEAQLARTEKERDEARKTASESVRQVQSLEEKLTEVSALFTGWKGGTGK